LRTNGNVRLGISSGFNDVLDEIDSAGISSDMADRLGRFPLVHRTKWEP
jgi:hypothetical protein